MQRIAVIGGGIAGLTVALRRSNAGDEVVLFEAAPKVGGQLVSESTNGFVVEHGGEGFVARSEAVPALAAEAGIASHIVEQLVQRSFRFDAGQLIALAPGEAGRLLGFQVASQELGRGIRSFWHGMAELPEQLALALGSRAKLRLGTWVASVAPRASGVTLSTSTGPSEDFDGVVVATTARSAATLLDEAFGSAARALRASALLSSLTVTLAFRREHVNHPLDATGFIVPDPEQLGGVRAVTFVSSKLPNRAPPGSVLLRVFFRPSAEDLSSLSDRSWAERAEGALGAALPLAGPAERTWVSRWSDALPVFDEPHRERVAALESLLLPHRIRLAGAAFHGSGIDAAIRSAQTAALAFGTT
jgi:protoporphyrinogen/coproporphyrinogen III oxidase